MFGNSKKKLAMLYDAAREVSENGRSNYYVKKIGGFDVIENRGANILVRGDNYYDFGRRIVIPNGIDVIGFEAFDGLDNIEEVIVSDTVKAIGYCAFYDCGNLSSVMLSRSVRIVGMRAFGNCPSLKVINAPREASFGFMSYDEEHCRIRFIN